MRILLAILLAWWPLGLAAPVDGFDGDGGEPGEDPSRDREPGDDPLGDEGGAEPNPREVSFQEMVRDAIDRKSYELLISDPKFNVNQDTLLPLEAYNLLWGTSRGDLDGLTPVQRHLFLRFFFPDKFPAQDALPPDAPDDAVFRIRIQNARLENPEPLQAQKLRFANSETANFPDSLKGKWPRELWTEVISGARGPQDLTEAEAMTLAQSLKSYSSSFPDGEESDLYSVLVLLNEGPFLVITRLTQQLPASQEKTWLTHEHNTADMIAPNPQVRNIPSLLLEFHGKTPVVQSVLSSLPYSSLVRMHVYFQNNVRAHAWAETLGTSNEDAEAIFADIRQNIEHAVGSRSVTFSTRYQLSKESFTKTLNLARFAKGLTFKLKDLTFLEVDALDAAVYGQEFPNLQTLSFDMIISPANPKPPYTFIKSETLEALLARKPGEPGKLRELRIKRYQVSSVAKVSELLRNRPKLTTLELDIFAKDPAGNRKIDLREIDNSPRLKSLSARLINKDSVAYAWQSFPSLTHLELDRLAIPAPGDSSLPEVPPKNNLGNLTHLALRGSELHDDDVRPVLAHLSPGILQTLDLQDNQLSAEFARSLREQFPTTRILVAENPLVPKELADQLGQVPAGGAPVPGGADPAVADPMPAGGDEGGAGPAPGVED